MKLIHIFPFDYKISGGHSNAILAFMQAQAQAGFDVAGISPLAEGVVGIDRTRYASLKIYCVESGDIHQAIQRCLSDDQPNLVVFYQSNFAVKRCAALQVNLHHVGN